LAFKIRVLTEKDYDKIIEVWKRAGLSFRPTGRDSREEIEKQMALDQEMFLGCFIDNELAGVVIGSYDARKGWINRLAVVPEHRRKGIAKALVRRIEETLKEKGFRIIGVLIEHDSEESTRLFSKAGYVKYDDIHYYTKREDKEV
jgi:ribosomal protein S18 acetylase RimI-like enzyme